MKESLALEWTEGTLLASAIIPYLKRFILHFNL